MNKGLWDLLETVRGEKMKSIKNLTIGLLVATLFASCNDKTVDGFGVKNYDDAYVLKQDQGMYFQRQLVDYKKDGTLDTAFTVVNSDKGSYTLPSKLTEADHKQYEKLFPKIHGLE